MVVFAVVVFAAMVVFSAAVVVVMSVVAMFFVAVMMMVVPVMMFRPFIGKQTWCEALGRFCHGPANILPGIVCLIIRELPGCVTGKAHDGARRFELAVFVGEAFELHFKEPAGHLSQIAADCCPYGSAKEGAGGGACEWEDFFDDATQYVFEDTACAARTAAEEAAYGAHCFFEQVAKEMIEFLFVVDGQQFAGEFHFGFFAEAGLSIGDLAVGSRAVVRAIATEFRLRGCSLLGCCGLSPLRLRSLRRRATRATGSACGGVSSRGLCNGRHIGCRRIGHRALECIDRIIARCHLLREILQGAEDKFFKVVCIVAGRCCGCCVGIYV